MIMPPVNQDSRDYFQKLKDLAINNELLDLSMVSTEQELVDFDTEVLKVYCKIKEIDSSGSDKEIRKRVWNHFEEELEMDSDDSEDEDESESEEEEPEPVIIKKKKSKEPNLE